MPGETEAQHARFSAWLFGPRRTPRSVRLRALDVDDRRLSERYGWKLRAAAWDRHVAGLRAQVERTLAADLVTAKIHALSGLARTQALIQARLEALAVDTLDLRDLRDLSLIAQRSAHTARSIAELCPEDLEAVDLAPPAPVADMTEAERDALADALAEQV